MKDNMEDIIYKIQELSQELVDNYKIKDMTIYVEAIMKQIESVSVS